MSTDDRQFEPELVTVDEAHRLRSPVKVVNAPVHGLTRRERRAARAKFRWLPPPRLPDETVRDFRIRELGLYVAARRAWKLKRRRATWGGNAWRVAS